MIAKRNFISAGVIDVETESPFKTEPHFKTQLIDGKQHSQSILAEIKEQTKILHPQVGRRPGLATILVGDNPASHVYVNIKRKRAVALGFVDFHKSFPANIEENELLTCIEDFNANDAVDGILIQLPLPKHMDTEKIIRKLNPEKDVDGFHPENLGQLFRTYTRQVLAPCTPHGIMELFRRESIETAGKHVVIIGRSNLVSKPLASMLVQKNNGALIGGNAIVTTVHSAASNIADYTAQADILIAAMGVAHFVTPEMIKKNAIVIDVGINQLPNNNNESNNKESSQKRLVGDVDFEKVLPKVNRITPVPGGVGPMTIAGLMENTLKIFKQRNNLPL